MTQFLADQNDRYLKLLTKKAQVEQEAKKRQERDRAEKERIEQEERERRRLAEQMEQQRQEELSRQESEKMIAEQLREEEERRRRQAAEREEEQRRAAEKMRQLEAMLAAEAEKNFRRQREEILDMLEADVAELARMEDATLILVDRQKRISGIRRRRRALFTIPEEEEELEEEELRQLAARTEMLLAALRTNGQDLGRLRARLQEAPVDLTCQIFKVLQCLELELQQQAGNLRDLHTDTELCHDKHAQLLENGLRWQREAEKETALLLKDEASLDSLKADVDSAKLRQSKMQLALETAPANTLSESAEKNNELDALKAQIKALAALEADIFTTAKDLEEWKAFSWPEAVESEMNRYGMVGSLSSPAFPERLRGNPVLQAAILARQEELRSLRERLAFETSRMAEICSALAEMEERRRDAELRRIAEQALVWTRDLVPMGPAEFGTLPTFR